jgi:hypothetical protein
LSQGVIVPVAKSVYLVDGTLGYPGGKTDLMVLFNSIRAASYPHRAKDFVVFAQLTQGLGRVPFCVEVRLGSTTGPLAYVSNVHHLRFPHRDMVVQLAYTVTGCRFPQPGIYLVELHCAGQWVADTTLLLQ